MDELPVLYPFVTRDMMAFKHGLGFTIRLISQGMVATPITLTGATREGKFTFRQTTSADGSPVTSDFKIPDFPIFASVNDPDNYNNQGQCRVTMQLLLDGDIAMTLGSGHITGRQSVSYPPAQVAEYRGGGGDVSLITGDAPAAGAEAAYAIPPYMTYRIIAVRVTLITSATVADRNVKLAIYDGMENEMRWYGNIVQAASVSRYYNFSAIGHQPTAAEGTNIMIPIPPDVILRPDSNMKTVTTNRQAGDQFSALDLLVERWVK